jgi:hypothetical protein
MFVHVIYIVDWMAVEYSGIILRGNKETTKLDGK